MTDRTPEAVIREIIDGAFNPAEYLGLAWSQLHRRLQSVPGEVMAKIERSDLILRLPEEIDWPVRVRTRPTKMAYDGRKEIIFEVKIGDAWHRHCLAVAEILLHDDDFTGHLSGLLVSETLEAASRPLREKTAKVVREAVEGLRRG